MHRPAISQDEKYASWSVAVLNRLLLPVTRWTIRPMAADPIKTEKMFLNGLK